MDTIDTYIIYSKSKYLKGTIAMDDDEHEFTLKETGLHCIAKVRYIFADLVTY